MQLTKLKKSAGVATAVVALIALIVIGGATAAFVLAMQPGPASSATSSSTTTSSLDSTLSTGNTVSSASCNQPPYLVKLASQVQQTQNFSQQSHGLSYVLAYGNNQSAETGTANGKSIYSPPETSLAFYSYGTTSTAVCPSNLGTEGVVGALWIQVPINSDGSYNLANMSIYYTAGVFTNSTAFSQSTSTTS
jgi:cytochrome bd-type quinol oxidase subunit 1